MALPDFSMRQLLEAGVHFGHQTHRWNPKMDKFIFGARNNVHILDLAQTVPMLYQALQAVSDTVAKGGRVLIVGTKRQATDHVADAARRSAQYYVNARWLGGMLTNWQTMSNSIKRLRSVEETLSEGAQGLTKKERLSLTRERDKLERALGGIKDMGGIPNLLFVIDTNKEAIALQEARRLNIPIAAVIDSNSNPDGIDFPVPGNDDAGRAISLYCDLIARAAIDGLSRGQTDMGIDLGASEEVPVELALNEPAEAEAPAEAQAEAPAEAPAETQAEAQSEAPAEPATETAAETPAPEKETDADTKSDAGQVALFEAPEGEPDDLKQISGVGPVLESKLHELGIRKFSQIANFSADDVTKVDDALAFKGRIDRDNWVEQATTLASQ